MDKGLVTVIGMSIAYVASFLGMGLAWWSWRKRRDGGESQGGGEGVGGGGGQGGDGGERR